MNKQNIQKLQGLEGLSLVTFNSMKGNFFAMAIYSESLSFSSLLFLYPLCLTVLSLSPSEHKILKCPSLLVE